MKVSICKTFLGAELADLAPLWEQFTILLVLNETNNQLLLTRFLCVKILAVLYQGGSHAQEVSLIHEVRPIL